MFNQSGLSVLLFVYTWGAPCDLATVISTVWARQQPDASLGEKESTVCILTNVKVSSPLVQDTFGKYPESSQAFTKTSIKHKNKIK